MLTMLGHDEGMNELKRKGDQTDLTDSQEIIKLIIFFILCFFFLKKTRSLIIISEEQTRMSQAISQVTIFSLILAVGTMTSRPSMMHVNQHVIFIFLCTVDRKLRKNTNLKQFLEDPEIK